MHGVDLTDSFEAFLPQLQIEATEGEEDASRKNYDFVVVSCFNQIDLLIGLQGFHELRLVPSLPVGLNLKKYTISIGWMILNLGELLD